MSSALVWQLVKDNNSFLVKRNRTARNGAVRFSTECANLLKVSSQKFSGIANEKNVCITPCLKLKVQDGKNNNKPSQAFKPVEIGTGKKGKQALVEAVKAVRGDLVTAATSRFYRLSRAQRIKKGHSKKVVKSTRRA